MAVYKRDMVDINLETGNIHRSFLKHSIGFKDAAADHFGIRVFRNGEPVSLTGVSVQGIFMPPQGSPIAITSGNIVSENEAEVVLPQACYNYDGQFTLSIKLVDATNAVTGTMRIVDGMVDNTHASGTVAPTSAVPTYQEILATYDAMVAATTAATTAATNVGSIVAAAYSTSATYAVGDYCTKDGNLYRCTTAITTAESWTAAHWTQTKMGPDVSDLKSALGADFKYIIGEENPIENVGLTTGAYINGSGEIVTNQPDFSYTDLIPIENVPYVLIWNRLNAETSNIRIHGYDSNGEWVKQLAYDADKTIGQHVVNLFNAPGHSYIRISFKHTLAKIVCLAKKENVTDNIKDINTAIRDSENKHFGLIGRKRINVSNQQYENITVFDNIPLLKDEYYHVIVTFDSAPNASGYAILKNSSDSEIARTNSFINVTKAELVYKKEGSDSTGNKLIISFNGTGTYSCIVEMYSVWEGEVNKIKRCFGATTFWKDDLRNGNTNNPQNGNYVSTPVMKMRGNSLYVLTDRPNSTNCIYRYQYRLVSKEVDDCMSDASSQISAEVSRSNAFNFNENNCIGVQIAIEEYNTSTNTESPLRISDFEGYHITVFDNSAYENNTSIRQNLTLLSSAKFDKTYMRNGSCTNPYNTNAVAVPVLKTRTNRIMARTDRPNKPNCIYVYNFITVLVDRDDMGYNTQASDYSDFTQYEYNTYELVHKNRLGVQVAFYEYNTSTGSYSALRIGDFDGYNIYVYDVGSVPNLIDGLPKYYDEYMSARIGTIRERDVDIANTGDSFVFVTDIHMENKLYSPMLAKYILDNSAVSSLIIGGDMINEPTSKQQAIEQLSTKASLFRVIDDAVFLRGNHDTNPYGTGQLTADEYYAIFNKHIEKYVDTKGKNYFYRDNVSQKIRYIFMDTGVSGEIDSTQLGWVQSVASELSTEWTIVLMAHWAVWYSDYTNMQPTNAMTAVAEALSGINAKVACIIAGHTHIDGSNDTAFSFPIIVATCDANGAQQVPGIPSVNRNGGTINEQSLNVFHINTSTKTIYMTRIGGGNVNVIESGDYTDNDQTFTYD